MQMAVEVDKFHLLYRIHQRAIEYAGFHSLLDLCHFGDILIEDGADTVAFHRREQLSLQQWLLALSVAHQRPDIEDALIWIVAIRTRAIKQCAVEPRQCRAIWEDVPVGPGLGNLLEAQRLWIAGAVSFGRRTAQFDRRHRG